MASKLRAFALSATAIIAGIASAQGGAASDPNHAAIVAERQHAGLATGLRGEEGKQLNELLLGQVNIPTSMGGGKTTLVQALTKFVWNPILKDAGSPITLPTHLDRDADEVEVRKVVDAFGNKEDDLYWAGNHRGNRNNMAPNGSIYLVGGNDANGVMQNNRTYPSWNNVVTGPAQYNGRPETRTINFILPPVAALPGQTEGWSGVDQEAIRINIEILGIPGRTVPTLRTIKAKIEAGELGNAKQMIEMMKPIQGRSHMYTWVPFNSDRTGWLNDANGKINELGRQQIIAGDNVARFFNKAFNFTPFINHNGRDVGPRIGGGEQALLQRSRPFAL